MIDRRHLTVDIEDMSIKRSNVKLTCELDIVLTVTSLKMLGTDWIKFYHLHFMKKYFENLEVLPPELVVPQPDTTACRKLLLSK